MGNKKICSKNLNVDGKLYSFADHAFFALSVTGEAIRIRHYRDLVKTGAKVSSGRYLGDEVTNARILDARRIVAMDPYAVRILVVPTKNSTDPLFTESSIRTARDILELDLYNNTFNQMPTSPYAVGSTYDGRRAKISTKLARARLTWEGGLAEGRSDIDELKLLAQSNRSSDAYYDTAEDRNGRQRSLVTKLTKSSPDSLRELVYALRQKDGLRTSAIMIAVDAIVCGHPQGRILLESALLRPDEPALALSYYLSTYASGSSKSLPNPLKKALASSAVRLYTDKSAANFDKVRSISVSDRSKKVKPVVFADVIALTNPKVAIDSEQYFLFEDLRNNTFKTPLRKIKRHLLNINREDRLNALKMEAAKVTTALANGEKYRSDYGDLPWQFLTSLVATGNVAVASARKKADAAAASLLTFENSPESIAIRKEARRLHTRVRDSYGNRAHVVSSSGPSREPTAEERAHVRVKKKDARDQLSAYCLTPEYINYIEQRRALHVAKRSALNDLKKASIIPGSIPKEVFEITVPSMSVSQIMFLLGAIERSDVDESIIKYVESTIEQEESLRLPDILRSVRGLSIGNIRSNLSTFSSPGGMSLSQSLWTGFEPSRWESAFTKNIDRKISAMLPDVSDKKVLILVDGSGSMFSEVSMRANDKRTANYSSLSCAEVASFVASAIGSKCSPDSEVVLYSALEDSQKVSVKESSVLESTRNIVANILGGGTETGKVLGHYVKDHDFVVVLTDEQFSDSLPSGSPVHHTPMLTVNFAGHSGAISDSPLHKVISGWSEEAFFAVNAMAAGILKAEKSAFTGESKTTSVANGYELGGVGPGGGIIFSVNSGTYLEAASMDRGPFNWEDACAAVRDCREGACTDWRLPSKDELNDMHENRHLIGGFSSDFYWSSSVYDANYAWFQYFSTGSQYYDNKINTNYVRPVRAFSI